MQENVASPKKPKNLWKVKVLAASVPLMAMVGMASAESMDLNATIGPVLDSVVALIPSIIGLVVAMVPAVVILAVISFVIGFLDNILGMMKLR